MTSQISEPDDSFGSCGQEGMQVIPQHRAEVVTQLAASLKAAGLSTQVIADESSETGEHSMSCVLINL